MIFKHILTATVTALYLTAGPMLQAASKHPVTGELLADDQTFTYNMGAEPPSIDPQLVEDTTGGEITNDLFEGLLVENADGSIAPGVAKSWEVDSTRKIYTFHLRHNAKWSNGEPVTAHDFEYAWKRLVNPELASPQAGYMETMAVKNATAIKKGEKKYTELGVKALDDYTFQVELDTPISYFLKFSIASATMPVPQKVIEKFGDQWTRPGNLVGNGAYILTEHKINERLVRERNPLYWNNEKTIINKVVSLAIGDLNLALNRYRAGELDKADIPTGSYKRLVKQIPDEVHTYPRLCVYNYTFNVKKPPFDNAKVRRALSYAINRDVITRHITGSGQTPAYSLTPPVTDGFIAPKTEFSSLTQKQREQKARELLKEAGYDASNPLKITISYNTLDSHKKIAIAISQMWKRTLNVKTTLENLEWKTFLTSRKQGDFEVGRYGFCGNNEPSSFLSLLETEGDFNDSGYSNKKVDQLLKEAKSLPDPGQNYLEIEKIQAQDFPEMPIYHYSTAILLKTWVKGWPFSNPAEVWYSKNFYITAH